MAHAMIRRETNSPRSEAVPAGHQVAPPAGFEPAHTAPESTDPHPCDLGRWPYLNVLGVRLGCARGSGEGSERVSAHLVARPDANPAWRYELANGHSARRGRAVLDRVVRHAEHGESVSVIAHGDHVATSIEVVYEMATSRSISI
jgi:hypothetical protein